MKQTGILLPVSSLPSRTGIGELGNYAFEWLDVLADTGITIWQILPLNPVGYGNSPYQPYSSCAGDELFISLDELHREGLLKEQPERFMETATMVHYDAVREWKETYLRQAFTNFRETKEYETFVKQKWVYFYGVYRTLKKANEGSCWNEWPKEQMFWPEKQAYDLTPYKEELRYQMFLQYEFYCQWMKVKEYAAGKQIKIMGDVPFYVGLDSADVWSAKENFLLDDKGQPTFIAGVPPDYFSATGQRWGNPIYDWDYMKKTKFQFWIDRIGYNQTLFDCIRIDHFRAFDTYWKIPISCPTAVVGEWIEAPGYEVLDTLMANIPDVSLVAEDLGMLRPEVNDLKNHYKLKGMKILEFSLNTDGKYAVDDFEDVENMIIYTGTHDNMTLREWYESLTTPQKRKIRRWLAGRGMKRGSVVERLIAYTLASRAEYAIIPMADILEEGALGHINTPGTIGSPNWEWKMANFEKAIKNLGKYKNYIQKREGGVR